MNVLKTYLQNVQELTKSYSQSWASIEIADLSTLLQIVEIQNKALHDLKPSVDGAIAYQAIQQVEMLVSGVKSE